MFSRRIPVLIPRLPLLAAVLVALAVFLVADGLPPVQAQQTPTVFISNTGQTASTAYSTASDSRVQQFTTGSQTGGYTLSSIDAVIGTTLNATQRGTVRAELWSTAQNTFPGSKLLDLTVPTTVSAGTVSFAAPANTTLSASTGYYFVIYTTGNVNLSLGTTASANEDSGGQTGWSIKDSSAAGSNVPATSWGARATPLRIRVNGPAAPAATANLSALTAQAATSSGGTFFPLEFRDADGDAFASGVTSYAISVVNAITHVKLTPTVADTGSATVKVGKSGSLAAVSDTTASTAIALDTGANAIVVEVTAADGTTTREYTLTVTRLAQGVKPTVKFLSVTEILTEAGSTSREVTFARLSAALPAATTVTLRVEERNTSQERGATEGDDFTISPKTLRFPAGRTTTQVTIQAVADETTEGNEAATMDMEAVSSSPYTLGDPAEVEIVIYDNSADPGLFLGDHVTSPFRVVEGNTHLLTIQLSPAPQQDVTPVLTVLGSSTATQGASGDFTLGTVPAIEGGGQGTQSVEVTLTTVEDSDDEPIEYIVLQATTAGYTSNVLVIRLLDDDAPHAPFYVTATPNPTNILLTWAMPNGTTRHQVQYKAATATEWQDFSGSILPVHRPFIETKSARIPGLANGTTYDVRVRATNSDGNNPWAYPNVWEAALTAEAVLNISAGCHTCTPATVLTDNKFTFAGQEYTITELYSTATQLTLNLAPSITDEAKTLDLRIGDDVYRGAAGTVSNEVNLQWTVSGNPFSDGVVAFVQLSDPKKTTPMPATPPIQLANLKVYRADSALVAAWDNSPQRFAVTRYQVEYKTAAAPNQGAATAGDPSTGWVGAGGSNLTDAHLTIGGLTNYTAYDVRARAVNAIGPGHWQHSPVRCTPEPTLAVWTATLTAKDLGSGEFGCNNTESGKECSASSVLTSDDFEYKDTEFDITEIIADPNNIHIEVTPQFSTQFKTDAVLVIDGVLYPAALGLDANNAHREIVWGHWPPGWAAEQSVSLSLQFLGLVPPDVPADLEAKSAEDALWVSWTASGGNPTSYDVHYKTAAAPDQAAATAGDPSTGWVDAGHTGTDTLQAIRNLTQNTLHDVRVRAVSEVGEGSWAQAQGTPRGAPVVGFSPISYEGRSKESTHTIVPVTVSISPVLLEDSSVTVVVLEDDPEHTAGPPNLQSDYRLPDRPTATVVLPAGEDTATFQVSLTSRVLAGKDVTLVMGLEAVGGAPYTTGQARAALVMINPNVMTLSFSSTETIGGMPVFRVAEGGSVALNVVSDRAASFPVTVNLTTGADADGSTPDATETTDYVLDVTSTTFPVLSRSPDPAVGIRTIADSVSDDGERLLVYLNVPANLPADELVTASPDPALVIIGPATTVTPAAPTALRAAGGHEQLTLAWVGPPETVTGYDVEYKLTTANSWTDAGHTGAASAHAITGLGNHVEYDVRVRAKNSAASTPAGPWVTAQGIPSPSPEDSVVMRQEQGGPGKGKIAFVVAGDRALTVAWNRPTAGSAGHIIGYDVQYRESTASSWVYAPHTGQARFLVITGLTNGTTYEVRMRARTGETTVGEWSEPVQGTPKAPVLPPLPSASHAVSELEPLDAGFATDGKVTTDFSSGDDRANAVAALSDGKIVAAGRAHNGSDYDFALARYNADGTLDTSFGGDGKATTHFGSGDDRANAVAALSDGKIVAAGRAHNGSDYDFALARYNADGTLDTSFGGDGKATTHFGSGDDRANALAVQPDGKIVVAGTAHNGTDTDFALARYNANGSLDVTFGTGGKVTVDIDGIDEVANAVALHYLGRIVAAGSVGGNTPNIALVCLDADGNLLDSFGDGGKVVTDVGGSALATAVTTAPGGTILVAGRGRTGSTGVDFLLLRYTHFGAPDTTFGDGGWVATPIGSGNVSEGAAAVAVRPDGKILAAGYARVGGADDFALARYDEHGRPDPLFGAGGKLTTAIGSGEDQAQAMALLPDGKIILVGYSSDDFAVARYHVEPRKAWINSAESGDGSVTVSWGRPIGHVTGFGVEYKESTATSWSYAGFALAEQRSYEIRNLFNGATYDVRVRARNGIGAGPWSNVRQVEIPACDGCGREGEEGAIANVPAGVTVNPTGLSLAEDGSASYTVALDSRPTADVTITAASSDGDAATVFPTVFTFTPSDWDTPETFYVDGVADDDTNDETLGISHTVTSADPNYSNLPVSTVRVEVSDTTTPGQQEQVPANQPPTVSAAIADAVIVNESGTHEVSLSGTFDDADGDSLTITEGSSNDAMATVSVSADGSSLTVTAGSRGTATVTVTADDGNGGTVSDSFTVRVKAAPVVSKAIGAVSGLEAGSTQEVSLPGVFTDADSDALLIEVASNDQAVATVSVAADQSGLTVTGVAEGSTVISVFAWDSDENMVIADFEVSVVKAPEPEEPEQEEGEKIAPTVVSPLPDLNLQGHEWRQFNLTDVFSGDDLTYTVESSNYGVATAWVRGTTLTVLGTGTGTATVTVTARDSDGNQVSDSLEVSVRPLVEG